MRLQFLIPQYKETDEVVRPLLDSIALQQNINFDELGVIIVNDGSDVRLSENLLNSYPFKIEYYLNEHKGVSATRNACLDHATADYVMFCDADDMFYNMCGLWIIFSEIARGGFDSLVSAFIEETKNPMTGEKIYVNHDFDSTFVHGKIHRRGYLLDKSIRFNDSLTIHEDSYFNILCQKCSQNVKYCQTPFYLWRWRDESVCRHDHLYLNKTYVNMLDSNTALVDQFLNRGMRQEAIFYSTMMLYDCYYSHNCDRWWNEEGKDYLPKTQKRVKEYYEKFKYLIDECDEQIKVQIIANLKNRYMQEGMLLERITYSDWIEEIKK